MDNNFKDIFYIQSLFILGQHHGARNPIQIIHDMPIFDRHFAFKTMFAIYLIPHAVPKTKVPVPQVEHSNIGDGPIG
jgi:hypothetical protein